MELKKIVSQYFGAVRKQVQLLYDEVYQAVDRFKFDNIIFREEENVVIEKLLDQDYNSVLCSDIAVVIPKLIKYTNFEDGHFVHLREYLKNERLKVPSLLDGIILNLPYFRYMGDTSDRAQDKKNRTNTYRYHQNGYEKQTRNQNNYKSGQNDFAQNTVALNPKIVDDQGQEEESTQLPQPRSNPFPQQKRQFIRNLCNLEKISSIEELELFCVYGLFYFRWNVQDQDFQAAFFQALVRYPFLRRVSVVTGYKITSTQYASRYFRFVDEIMNESSIEKRIVKKDWAF